MSTFTFGCGDAPFAEVIDDRDRMDFIADLDPGQLAQLKFDAYKNHLGNLRQAIDAAMVRLFQ